MDEPDKKKIKNEIFLNYEFRKGKGVPSVALFGEEEEAPDDSVDRDMAAEEFLRRGQKYVRENEFGLAISEWEKGIRTEPTPLLRAKLCEAMAQVFLVQEQWMLSIRHADLAVAALPNWYPAHLTRGRALLNLGEPSMAVSSLNEAMRLCDDKDEIAEIHQDLEFANEQCRRAKEMREQLSEEDRMHVTCREGQQPVSGCRHRTDIHT